MRVSYYYQTIEDYWNVAALYYTQNTQNAQNALTKEHMDLVQ